MQAMERLQILWDIVRQGVPCLFHLLTGLYCPGCGGTRAVWYLLHGRIFESIRYHPLVPYTVVVLTAEITIRLFVMRRHDKTARREDSPKSCRRHPELPVRRYEIETLVGAAITAANWIFKNYMLVFRGVDLLAGRPF